MKYNLFCYIDKYINMYLKYKYNDILINLFRTKNYLCIKEILHTYDKYKISNLCFKI